MNAPANPNHLVEFLAAHPRLLVLTGAGVSAPSGIPTYRDQQGRWLHTTPIQHRDFVSDGATRARYWARSVRGWPLVRDASPNAAHTSLAALEAGGRVEAVITQNVDRLHQRAGSRNVIDLHGRLDRVVCLGCGVRMTRERMQQSLLALNGPVEADEAGDERPDGDRDVADGVVAAMRVPACRSCGGDLMPDVVFYGGTVPGSRVARCREHLGRADAVLAIGSSLQVYSGYRFCREAAAAGKPIAILNPGPTRADELAALRVEAPGEVVLPALVSAIG